MISSAQILPVIRQVVDPGAGGTKVEPQSGPTVPRVDLCYLTTISKGGCRLNRTRAMVYSLVLAVALNMVAGLITVAYANGSTIVETNPSSDYLLGLLGVAGVLVRGVEIASLYSLAYLLSLAIASKRPILSSKRIYLFSFSFLISILPAASFADFLNDVMVVSFDSDLLAGIVRIFAFGLIASLVFAGVQTARGWTLPSAPLK